MPPPVTDFLDIFRVLAEARVDYLVIGGVAAVLQGAPIVTMDLDLVHSRSPDNIERLLKALAALEARSRLPGHEDRAPEKSHLRSRGHQLLLTRAGPLDLLGSVVGGRGYDELVVRTTLLELGIGRPVRVLDLETVIEIKEAVGRDKDRAVVAVLRSTLEESKLR